MLVPDFLRDRAANDPERVAVILDGVGRLTYAEWEAESNRVARTLVALGVAPGDRVGLLFSNRDGLDHAVCYLAIHKAGGVAVPLNPRLTVPELTQLIEHSGTVALLVGREREPDVEALRPSLSGCAAVLERSAITSARREGDASPVQVERSGEDLADIIYTSGTTGLPKGVACTHENITYRNAKAEKIFEGGTFLHALPLYTFGGSHGMTLMPLRTGMTNVVMPKFDATRFLELVAEHQVQAAYAVPSMVLLMLDTERVKAGGFDSLKILMYGTAPMPPWAILRLAAVFPGTFLVNAYGLTEGGMAALTLPPWEATKRPASIGMPVPPIEAKVIDEEGNTLPAEREGEICLRAPVKPRRYYRDDEASRRTWTDDGWVKTGDVGYLDADGYLYLVDRKKDLVIRGGHNVSAPEVEAALLQHPAVCEAAVVGTPHPVLGEDTHACVVLRETGATAAELEAFLRERLADYKVPRRYTFLDVLPRSEIGKVLKRELRASLLATQEAGA